MARILPDLADTPGVDWATPLDDWPRETMIAFLTKALAWCARRRSPVTGGRHHAQGPGHDAVGVSRMLDFNRANVSKRAQRGDQRADRGAEPPEKSTANILARRLSAASACAGSSTTGWAIRSTRHGREISSPADITSKK